MVDIGTGWIRMTRCGYAMFDPDSNPLSLFTCLVSCWEGGPGAFEGESMSLSMEFVKSIVFCVCGWRVFDHVLVRVSDFSVCAFAAMGGDGGIF